MPIDPPFRGAKLALLHEGQILAYLRDDKPSIPHPGCWDLPGGGREGDESPLDCVLRETEEEFGLRLPPERITYQRFYSSREPHRHGSVFLLGMIEATEIAAVRFGDEGQHWRMMGLHEVLTDPLSVPSLVERLGDALAVYP